MKQLSSILLLIGFLWATSPHAQSVPRQSPMVGFLLEYLSIKYPDTKFDTFIYVAAKKQKLYLIQDGLIVDEFTVSTAANGIGSTFGSFKTPVGLHRIAEKVGDDLPLKTIISKKVSTGVLASIDTSGHDTGKDVITTRVLHLDGMEDHVNKGGESDSYSRGIFIHGTQEEGRLGSPASKGCIRMGNVDIAALFQKVEVDTFVIILNN